jgi:Spy/CpxP family protein refolding chaperone
MRPVSAILFVAATGIAHGQHQPYAGQQARDIKALSAEEVKQYREGAGMGYAKPAELNHYPGPAHVLELADQIELTPEQRAEAKRLKDAHRAEARVLGAKLIEAERKLEALFRRGKVGETELAEAVRDAAALQGKYRLSHLETHRRMRALLTDEQVSQYDALRGYVSQADRVHGREH